MIETKINRLKNLVQKIKNEINLENLSNYFEWFYRKIEINFLFKSTNEFYPKKGEIYFVNLGQNIGSELNKIRPCLIYSDKNFNNSGTVVIIPLTSYKGRFNRQYQIKIKNSKSNNLDGISLAIITQITTISKKRIDKKIGNLEINFLKEINKKILKMLAIKKDEDN